MTLGIWRRGDPVHRSQRAGHRGGRLVRWRHRARAYSPPRQRVPSRPGDPFEPVRAETPAPIPTWAWVLFLLVAAWGACGTWPPSSGRIGSGRWQRRLLRARRRPPRVRRGPSASRRRLRWASKCTGTNARRAISSPGRGCRGCFPAQRQRGRDLVRSDGAHPHRAARTDWQDHRRRGVRYRHAPFADQLSDEEVAAVLNHERTSWGNQTPPVKPEDVIARR
jgi:hypothetical protein